MVATVGDEEGACEGVKVGENDGDEVGDGEGACDGAKVGENDGDEVGARVGAAEPTRTTAGEARTPSSKSEAFAHKEIRGISRGGLLGEEAPGELLELLDLLEDEEAPAAPPAFCCMGGGAAAAQHARSCTGTPRRRA